MQEARFYDRIDAETVQCSLCPHRCRISEGKRGRCRARLCRGGTLYAATYGEAASLAMDPIEKKPLYHFHPRAAILSIGTNGCNLRCQWCQNWHLSDCQASVRDAAPEQIVSLAKQHNSVGIAYTYNEPLVWYEYVQDCAMLAREAGLANVLVTNGSINPEPLAELLPLIDALNIDLKSIEDDDYKQHCKGRLAPVQDSIREANKVCHVEVTNLIVTGVNDNQDHLARLVDFVASVDKTIPLHFSRYSPNFNFSSPATPPQALKLAHDLGSAKLDYVYLGNVLMRGSSDTKCPGCGALLISRSGYQTQVLGVKDGKCAKCATEPNIVW